jgi:hypothetical protein
LRNVQWGRVGRRSDTFHNRWKVQCGDGEMPIVRLAVKTSRE